LSHNFWHRIRETVHIAICQELPDRASKDDNFLKRITTSNETWIYGYDVETKIQSSWWAVKNLPRRKKAWWVRFFFYIEGVVHHEFLHQGHTVDQWYYLEVLECLKCQEKKTSVVEKQLWFLHHDKCASSCTATDSWLFGQHEHNCASSATLLTQPGFSRLFPISQTEIHFGRMTISDDQEIT
jgi:hypothetical protein